jgi:hypothetical protein
MDRGVSTLVGPARRSGAFCGLKSRFGGALLRRRYGGEYIATLAFWKVAPGGGSLAIASS